jgi:hypothetical protein
MGRWERKVHNEGKGIEQLLVEMFVGDRVGLVGWTMDMSLVELKVDGVVV